MSDERNPLLDPQADDIVRGSIDGVPTTIHVHFVENGMVYMAKFRGDDDPGRRVRSTIEQWREDCKTANAEVVERVNE